MSAAIKLTPEEQEDLVCLPCSLRSLYIFALRVRMDYRTGIVGQYGRLSYDRIRDDLDHETLPGEKRHRPSRDFVKRALRRLEKQGLIVRCSRPRKLIIHLPQAEYDLRKVLEQQAARGSLDLAQMASQAALRSALITPPRPPSSEPAIEPANQTVTTNSPVRPPSLTPLGRPEVRPPDPEDPELDPEHTHARACARDGKGVASFEAAKGVCVQGETGEEEAIIRIWEHWKSVMDAQDAVLDPKRRYCIQRALGWGYTPAQLCEAITGCSQSPFHMGNSSKGQVFNGLSTILRDAEQIDRMRSSTTSPGTSGERIRHGFPESVLEAHARPGEEYEHVAARLRAQRDNEVRTTQEGK